MRTTYPTAVAALAFVGLAALAACEGYDEHPPYPDVVAASEVTPPPPADAASGTPVACTVLAGTWQVSVCDRPATAVTLNPAGCIVSVMSSSPELHGGTGTLENGTTLRLALPGGAHGQLLCTATMTPTTFSGTCTSQTGPCNVAGVKG